MKTTHALNFLFVGLAMCFGPALWPQWFSRAIVADASELWLLLMGSAQALLGALVAGLNEVPRLHRWFTDWEPFRMDFALPDVSWALTESFYAGLDADEEVRIALGLQQQLQLGRG